MKYRNILYCLSPAVLLPVLLQHNAPQPIVKQPVVIMPVNTTVDVSNLTGLPKIVALCQNFKATLTPEQVALLQLTYSKATAVRWSNFPQQFSNPNRVGLSLGKLNDTQFKAFKALMTVALADGVANEGFDELQGIRAADDYIAKNTGQSTTFGASNYYIAFLGTPSLTGLWELQCGGHHFAFANTYDKGEITGATPSFRGVEPMKAITDNGKTFQAMDQERAAFAGMIGSLTESQKTAAKLSGTYDDIILGPGRDGQFPNKKEGVKASTLTAAQQQQIITAIKLYVNDLDAETANAILKKYVAELPDTYISFSGTGTMEKATDYVRIDGPGVWIEYAAQPSRDFANTTHPHSVWRDHKTDYGGN